MLDIAGRQKRQRTDFVHVVSEFRIVLVVGFQSKILKEIFNRLIRKVISGDLRKLFEEYSSVDERSNQRPLIDSSLC